MNLVSAERIGKSYAGRTLLADVTVGIDEGDRVGVIGRNGSGKSTLLRLLSGLEAPDDGRVVHAQRLSVAFVGQRPDLDLGATVMDGVVGHGDAARAAERFRSATAAMRHAPSDPHAQAELAAATEAMDAVAAWDLSHVASELVDRLGLGDPHARIETLSGGQRRRVALARGLVQADLAARIGDGVSLLVLDEPTNHLDVDVIEWLEGWLRQISGALLLVTHDRYLLDRVSTRIVEVHDTSIATHHGSYGDYLEEREQRAEAARTTEHKRRRQATAELAWLRRSPSARTTKSRARVERATALQQAEPAAAPDDLVLDLPARRIGSSVVRLHNVGARFGAHRVLRGVTHELTPGERLGIVGPNGSGKTTLLSIIAGRRPPDDGSVRTGSTVVPGWFGQEPEPLARRTRVIDAVKEVVLETNTTDGITLSASGLLERFGFAGDSQRQHVEELSGGERRRLELLRVLAAAPNLLLLDEPTNDLDLDTLAVLEEYLQRWPGTLVVASHDRFLLDRVCTNLMSIEPDGGVRQHVGGWTAYREWVQARRAARSAPPRPSSRRSGQPAAAPGRRRSADHRREHAALERRIAALESRRGDLERAVQAAADDYEAARSAGEELLRVTGELDEAETRWLELEMLSE